MQVDAYTKFILTVIALCLLLDLAKDLSTPAVAEVGTSQVDVVRVGGLNVYNGILPVRICK